MPLRKKANKINLAETYKYVTRDNSLTSDKYFGIVKFPDRLTAGKNLFKLRINNTNFVENSQIHIEVLDFNGDPIYWEPLFYIEKDGTRVIAIYIYPETPPGNATIYVAGRLREGGGTGLPFSRDFNSPQHADIPNILWSRTVPVAPFASNDSEIIFTTQPKLTITEVVQPYLQPVNLTNVFTRVSASAGASITIVPQPSTTTQAAAAPAAPEGGLSAGTPNFGKQFFDISAIQTSLQQSNNTQMDSPPLNTLSGFSKLTTTNFALSKSMEGGVLVVNNPIISVPPLTGRNSANKVIPGSQTITQWNNNSPNSVTNQTLSGSYKFAIVQVINSTTARVSQYAGFANDDDNTYGPWSVQIRKGNVSTLSSPAGITYVQPSTQTINRIETATSFTASYTKPTAVIYTQNSSSFADIILANTEPATGDVYRIKTLYKPSGFFGDFIDLGDTILERQNILVDSGSLETNIAVGSAYEQYGSFESLQEINTYWSASSVGNLAANPMTIAYDDDVLIGGADLRTNWSGVNQYTASIGAASIFQIKKIYRPTIYKDTTYIVNFQVGLPNNIKSYTSLDSNILNNRLDVYISGSAVTPETETLNVSIGDVFVERNIPATLTGVFADGNKLGTRIGSVRCKSIPGATAAVSMQFKALRTGTMDIKFVTRRGTWLLGEIEVLADKQTGFSPNYVRVFKRIPTEHLKTPLTFKFQYYDFRGNKADLETISYGAIFKGGNVYIDGNNNLMTGSTYIGNTVGSGIEMAGVSSGYLRSVGYKGFTSASLGKGPGGFLMWSGSNNLTVGVDTYLGVGLELIAGSGSYFRYRTNPSEIIVQTDKFFFGSQNQYISGANGNIEISSSNFHLDANGNVTMQGTITATAGNIGGFTIKSSSLASSNGNMFISGSPLIGGVNNRRYMFISSSRFNVKQNGDITGSQVLFTGGRIGGFNLSANSIRSATANAFFISGSANNSGANQKSNMFISASRFNVKGNGDITGSQVLFTGGRIGGFNLSANSIRSATANAFFISGSANNSGANLKSNMFISASRFNVKGNGDITGSQVLFTGGKVGGFRITNQVISGANIIIDSAGSIRTGNYIPDFQGWAITATGNGFAEFENAKIRGTLSTAVFEKQSVNAVGGQLYIANSTVLTGSSQYPNGNHPASATTMSVENVTGFIAGEILSAKKVTSTGFKTEYIRVMSASRFFPASETNLSGRLFVQRAYGSGVSGPSASLGGTPGTAQSYSGSQVLVSTGRIGTGYIRINANPQDDSTPFIDIVERTGSGIYAVDLKARLGDLSGLSGTSKVLGRTNPGFGLATDNVYLQGGINARFGNIGGFAITQHAITGSGFFLSGSAPNSGVNLRRNMFISSSRFNVKGNGDITGSQVLFTGGRIGGFNISANSIRSATANAFFISGSANNSGANLKSNMFISASRFNVKGNGDITASNALFSGNVTAANFTVRLVTVVNANSGSYLRSVTGGKNLVFNGALGGLRTYAMSIDVGSPFVIKGVELPNTGSGINNTVDVYIQTQGITFDDAVIGGISSAFPAR